MIDTMKYGPQTAEVEALLGRVRTLTRTEATALKAAQGAARDAAWGAAREAARDAARDAVRGAVWAALLDAARVAVRGAVWDAVLALVARDQITPAGFTQEHYDLLTGPWRRVIGKVHPDDEEVR